MIDENLSWQMYFANTITVRAWRESLDAHFLRAMRNLTEIGKIRKKREAFYLKVAEMLRTWTGWTGFGK